MISFAITTSCGQNEDLSKEVETIVEENQAKETKHKDAHSYGGWYCPDNLGGFPPVDITALDMVPVVNGRLPTREETQNGTSLMYFDTTEIPDAKPLDMIFPKLAWYYSRHTNKNELIIVIQAVVIEADTVVGFRYLNGGNGSAWYDEVDFLTASETQDLGPTPFVQLDTEIEATKEEIWKAISSTQYIEKLGDLFNERTFYQSLWQPDSYINLKHESDDMNVTGMANNYWGTMYLQVDYDRKGEQSVEKVLILPSEDGKSATLKVVSGPLGADYDDQQLVWEKWLKEVKGLSEKN